MSAVVGVDAGLTTTTVVIYDTDGQVHAEASCDTPTARPQEGFREVGLDTLWGAVAKVIKTAVSRAGDVKIVGVGIAGHGHGAYLLDDQGKAVRPGIKSTDIRGAEVVDTWEADGRADIMRHRLGYGPFGADPLSILQWLSVHEPGSLDSLDTLLFCKDYLKYRLTDQCCTDEMEASVFYEFGTDSYASGIFRDLELPVDDSILPSVVPSQTTCGTVTEEAARITGLPAGVPVASGLHDVGATALGLGAYQAGQSALIVGTWGQSIAIQETVETNEKSAGLTRRFLDERYLRYKGLRSATACLEWFTDQFGDVWDREAAKREVSPYTVYNETVASVPPGANGLLFHPYIDGSTDSPVDRGGFYGLTSEHTRADMLRAVYEGVALGQAIRLSEVTRDRHANDLRLGGGGARSAVWADIFASATEIDIQIPANEEAGACGAAICAALAAGIFETHDQAIAEFVSIARQHEPDPEATAIYADRKSVFNQALSAIQPTWKDLSQPIESQSL